MKLERLLGVVLALCLFQLASNALAASLQFLHGHGLPAWAHLQPMGRLAETNRLNLAISLPLRNQAQLTTLLNDLYNPASPNYHHFLAPGQFAEQFGPSESDYLAVIAFAKANDLIVTRTYSNHILVDVNASVGDIERVLHLTFNIYKHPTENRTFFAPANEPSLNLSVPILHISGLDNYELPRPRLIANEIASAQTVSPNSGSGPGGTYKGYDFRAAYVPGVSLNGSGQMVGLLEFDGYSPPDIQYYENSAGLPNVPLEDVLIDGARAGTEGSGGDVEVALDMEVAISMATNLSKLIVYQAPNDAPFEDILNQMAADDQVSQFSCSWYIYGGTAQAAADDIWQEMALQGQSFFNASGDDDAWAGLIFFPGDSPYITQVGGTTLTTTGPGGAWSSETVWNWGVEIGPQYNGVGSGGGVSTQYPIPSWQTNISMTTNQGSTTMRNTPDVAMTADNVYVRADGHDYSVGGTSCAAPLWAGFMALVNQEAVASGRSTVGFINPALDTIGTGAGYESAFHDITTGKNTWSGSPTKFYAVPGYDLCSGWGTPAGQPLIDALANPEPLIITPANGFISIGGVGGPFTVPSQELSLTNAGTNSLTWTLSNTSSWLNVSPTGGVLTPGGPASTVTISLNNTASNLLVGTYDATLWFTNVNDGFGQSCQFTLNVISPPNINPQPANQAVLEGATAAFVISATGGLPLSYQWQFNGTNLTDGGNIAGSATANLVISDVSSNDLGSYNVVVTNFAGIVISSNVTLAIISSAPVIVQQPTNETVFVGQSAFLDVTAYGNMPLAYQWIFDGTNIMGATNSIYMLANAQLTNTGNYSVLITNVIGSVLSSNAALTVQTAALVGYWPCSEGSGTVLHDLINGNNGTIYNGAWGSGISGADLNFNGSSTYVGIPSMANLNFGAGSFSISVWFYGGPLASQHNEYPAILSNNPGGWQSGSFALRWQNKGEDDMTVHWNPEGDPVLDSGTLNGQQWYNAVLTRNGTNLSLYIDAVLSATASVGASDPINLGNGGNLLLGGNTWDGGQSYYLGSLEQLRLYQGALTQEQITNLYTVIAPPMITTQPQSQAVVAGNGATFNVVANSSVLPSYQWQFNGTNLTDGGNIAGSATANLVISDVSSNDLGNYDVVVANVLGSTTSSNALLTLIAPTAPVITAQPTNQAVLLDGTASFSVTAVGPSPLSYQWSFNTTNIVGATNATLTLTNVQFSQAGAYAVLVTNNYGSTLSSNAALTVQTAALVGYWPCSEGSGTVLHDLINGNNGTIYNGAWGSGISGADLNFNGSSTYVGIPSMANLNFGAGSFSISVWFYGGPLASQHNEYPAILSNNPGGWQSGSFALRWQNKGEDDMTVHWNPEGDPVLDSGTLNGQQWYNAVLTRNGTNLSLYIDAVLSATASVGASDPINLGNGGNLLLGGNTWDGGQSYYLGSLEQLRLYQGALTQEQITNLYTVIAPPMITTQPQSQAVVAGNGATFNVVANSSVLPSYQWQFNGTNLTDGGNIAGSATANLVISDVSSNDLGNYDVVVANVLGSTTSSNALLTLIAPTAPVITAQPTNQAVLLDGTASFSVTAVGPSPLSYQWSFNTTNIVGATNATLTLTNVQFSQAGAYAVLVTNNYGSTLSSNAALTVQTAALVGYWPCSEGSGTVLHDLINGNNGTIYNGAWGSGISGADLNFNGSSTYVGIPSMANLNFGAGSFSISVWFYGGPLASQHNEYPAILSNNPGGWQSGSFALRWQNKGEDDMTVHWNPEGDPVLDSGTLNGQQWYNAVLTRNGTNLSLYIDAVLSATASVGASDPINLGNGGNLLLGGNTWDGGQSYYLGSLEQLRLYQGALTQEQITNLYTVIAPPMITTQPQSQAVVAGNGATFNVVANSSVLPSYQWQFNGTNLTDGGNIAGSATANLVISDVSSNDLGNYDVVVANVLGSTTSSNALLTIYATPPAIATQPTNQTVSASSSATFSVTVSGTPPLSFQWNFNSTNIISGATNSILTLTNVQYVNGGLYSVTVTNLYGSATSSNALLIVTVDHFAWSNIISPRFAGAPFPVEIVAQNAANGVFTNYTGIVFLSTTNGCFVSPTVSGSFIQGIWTGMVTVSRTATNLVLSASDGSDHTGLANPINIVSLPPITASPSGRTLYLSWPTNPAGFLLETSTNLASGIWLPITAHPLQFGGLYVEPITPSETNASVFYRLYFTGQ